MSVIPIILFLIAATTFEAFGDALVRIGIAQSAWGLRALFFSAGTILLFGYGLSINLAPAEFGRVVGLYIAILFVVWQTVTVLVFGSVPRGPVLFGGLLIVIGGIIVTFWK